MVEFQLSAGSCIPVKAEEGMELGALESPFEETTGASETKRSGLIEPGAQDEGTCVCNRDRSGEGEPEKNEISAICCPRGAGYGSPDVPTIGLFDGSVDQAASKGTREAVGNFEICPTDGCGEVGIVKPQVSDG